jgi:hypothetical protein
MSDLERLAPHGGCWREGCKICNTPTNPYPKSWRPQAEEEPMTSFDLNTLKEMTERQWAEETDT